MSRPTDGLLKRCGCPRRQWLRCPHAWHLNFFCKRTASAYGGKAKHGYTLDVIATARGEVAPRTKFDAIQWADRIRGEIRAGTFVDPHRPAPLSAADPTALTVGDVIEQYLTRHVHAPGRRASGAATMVWHLATLRRTEIPGHGGQRIRFEQKPIKDVVKADVEALRAARRAHAAATGRTSGEVGCNRLLQRLRHLFSWSVAEGYRPDTPFTRGGQVVVKLAKETPRDRRLLDAGEEDRLLQHAAPHLKDLIVAALSTGARLGELLSLQWQDIRTTTTAPGQTRQTLIFKAEKTKTATTREIPVGRRLATVLTMRRTAPDGLPFAPTAFIFGNAAGEPVGSIKRAWQTCVLKAHGHTPTWDTKNHLSPESRAAYRAVGLHFHDLRREAGSRLVEAGASLVEARDLMLIQPSPCTY